MTKKELSQLYYLNREIEELQSRIAELEVKAESTSKPITGMPNVPGISDKTGRYAAEIADLKSLLDLNLKKCFYELNRLNRYIQSIEDSEMRNILSFRYINGLCWEQVAASISPYASGESVRKAHDRFLKKN
ncbi:MAG: sigma-70 family RNA polymerase sigma factor [Candidatus Niameybacter stercoravium]|nr:sigma-70 family RNA polymerase sigma factor [Candidatus Niameybacter stercoravium]